MAEAYKLFIEEAKGISTVQDLDYLFIKLKGTGAEELLKAIDEEEDRKESGDIEPPIQ